MKHITCEKCGKTVPMGSSWQWDKTVLCEVCCEQAAANHDGDIPVDVAQQVDPTICQRCGKDGHSENPVVGGFRVCRDCAGIMNNFPFPLWIRVSAVGLLALVVFSTAWNMRFIQGSRELKKSMAALNSGDWTTAEQLMYAAFDHVPESRDLEALAAYFHGHAALKNNDSKEAVRFFKKADARLPPELGTWFLLRQAQISLAFDEKNYDAFLFFSKEVAEKYPDNIFVQGSVASAYACKYAVTGEPEFRLQAVQVLDHIATLPGADNPEWTAYHHRIHHRLETREIISREEFEQRFPDGWPAKEETF